jgi:hypothetical protein
VTDARFENGVGYIDDLCFDTTVTLLSCVRTSSDVIFQGE